MSVNGTLERLQTGTATYLEPTSRLRLPFIVKPTMPPMRLYQTVHATRAARMHIQPPQPTFNNKAFYLSIPVANFMRRLVIEVVERQRKTALRVRRFCNVTAVSDQRALNLQTAPEAHAENKDGVVPARDLVSGYRDDGLADKTQGLSIASLLPSVAQACCQPRAGVSACVRNANNNADTHLGQDADGGHVERPRTCQEALPPANKRPLLAFVGQPPGPPVAALDGLALDMDGQVPGPTLAAVFGEGRLKDGRGLPAYRGADGAVDTSEG